MPRRKRSHRGNAFEQVRQQARTLVTALRGEIRVKEAELKRLKQEAAALRRLGGGAAPAVRKARAVRVKRSSARRIDWGKVLEQLPRQFKASDIRVINQVKSKRPSEIFAAITRWIEGGAAKRKARGVYERS